MARRIRSRSAPRIAPAIAPAEVCFELAPEVSTVCPPGTPVGLPLAAAPPTEADPWNVAECERDEESGGEESEEPELDDE